jgi:hypothetical protein
VGATLTDIFTGAAAAFVLFSHGTVVAFEIPVHDPEHEASEIIKEYGPVVPGGELGDFGVHELTPNRGWLVTCAHPWMFTYVSSAQGRAETPAVAAGLFGRDMRDLDSHEQEIIYVGGKMTGTSRDN